MRNARLDELQARIKIGGRNINNLRYADDTTLMAEGKEKLPGASTGDPTHDKVMWRDLMSKADQDSRDPLDLLEHLPQNQNLSVLLFYAFHQLFWH